MQLKAEISEEELASQCKQGERYARQILYERYGGVLMAICLRYIGNNEEAEDVLHDGFLHIFQAITQFTYKGEGSVTINGISSQTYLRYANMKLINWHEIEQNEGKITPSGQIEKVLDVEQGWFTVEELVDLAIDGITSFTTSPLRISTYISIPTFVVLFIYFAYVIAKCIVTSTMIQAYQAIILLILFFSGVQILLIGIIGEYLGRIFNESKNRPLYLVNEYNGRKEMND